jgi:predicted regulator of Ras-like GTPase activity (Roadblock/LC7/MglB family)
MDAILKTLTSLKGIHYASFCQDNGACHSNFPPEYEDKITNIHETMEQLYSAIVAIEKEHNEIYWVLDEHMLISFNINDVGIFVLLTEKKVNFPLISMGIKSATSKIKKLH